MDGSMRVCGWGLAGTLSVVCFYGSLYGLLRSQGVLKRKMIGNAEYQHYWIAGDQKTETGRLVSLVFKPLATLEGLVTTKLLSEEYVLLGVDEL